MTDPRAGRRFPRRGKRGFTLIELLVVVVIIGILFSVVLPVIVGLQRGRKPGPAGAPAGVVRPSGPRAASLPAGSPPELDAAEVAFRVEAANQRIGLDVFTRYQAHARARLVVRAPRPGSVRLEVPFPAGTIEARAVLLRIEGPGGLVEPPGVRYDAGGIHWVGVLPAAPTTFRAEFVTRGGEAFEYRLPPAARTRSAVVDLAIAGAPRFTVPDRSLQPSSTGDARLTWRLTNLVTDRPLVVELPAADSPLGRTSRLFQLAGLAVLLFGAGFWYQGDLRRPGALDDFRWGDFLLLALTYSTFFVIVAVLGFHGQVATPVALALAAAISLALLLVHVARVLGARFALRDALPLAATSFALVVNGVYGEAWRDYVFLAAGVAALAYLTATFPAWTAGRQAHADRQRAAHEAEQQAAREADAAAATPQLAPTLGDACGAGRHCLACGAPGAGTPFCAACGTARPTDLACARCEAVLVLPTHLMLADAAHRLHCRGCGAGLPA